MDDKEAKKLRDELVEYEGYLQEMRKVTMKNVETLDVIQRYTDKSAAGMQKLAEQSLDGVQKVTAESAGGIRRIIETGTSNLSKMGSAGESNVNRVTEAGLSKIEKASEEALQKLEELAEASNSQNRQLIEECLQALKTATDSSLDAMDALVQESGLKLQNATDKNEEAAARVEEIREAVSAHMESVQEMLRQSDEFTHKENVKVYRNVQAALVEELKKQTETLTEAAAEVMNKSRSLKPLVTITLIASLANLLLLILNLAGLF